MFDNTNFDGIFLAKYNRVYFVLYPIVLKKKKNKTKLEPSKSIILTNSQDSQS